MVGPKSRQRPVHSWAFPRTARQPVFIPGFRCACCASRIETKQGSQAQRRARDPGPTRTHLIVQNRTSAKRKLPVKLQVAGALSGVGGSGGAITGGTSGASGCGGRASGGVSGSGGSVGVITDGVSGSGGAITGGTSGVRGFGARVTAAVSGSGGPDGLVTGGVSGSGGGPLGAQWRRSERRRSWQRRKRW
jgi:hypothetical protein